MGKDLNGKELGVGLTQRKDGKYSAKIKYRNGVRVEKYFNKLNGEDGAKKWLTIERAKNMTDIDLVRKSITVNEWYDIWMKAFNNGIKADKTADGYSSRYESSIRDKIGYYKLKDVSKVDCQNVINDMCDKGYARTTIDHAKVTLHCLFKDAVDSKYLNSNPASRLKTKITVPEMEERRVLTLSEQAEFLQFASGTQYCNAYLLVLETGLRVGEVGGLQWEDIDFDKKNLRINRTLLQNSKRGGFYFGNPKSKNSRRDIPLTEKSIQILKDQKRQQEMMKFKSKAWTDDERWNDLVFTTVNGKPVGESTFAQMLRRICKNINDAREMNGQTESFDHVYMHALRHTFATRCIEAGMKPNVLQKILGHSTILTTMSLYVHVTDDERFSEIQLLEKYIDERVS